MAPARERGNGGWLTPQTGSYPAPNPPDGDYFEFTFTGTAVQAYLSSAFGSGSYVVYMDGVYHGTVNIGGSTTYSVTGLAHGSHTLRWRRLPLPIPMGSSPRSAASPSPGRDCGTTKPAAATAKSAMMSTTRTSNPGGFSYNFNGSGVEVITTRDSDARIAYFSVSGMDRSMGARYNNYSPTRQTGTSVFKRPNLAPGSYSVSVSHAANTSGMNFSFARLAIDVIRVYKGESLSSAPLFWGASGNGGSGTWDRPTANWHDGGQATAWNDFGGTDYRAVFGGMAGTVTSHPNVKANRVTIQIPRVYLPRQRPCPQWHLPGHTVDAKATIASTLMVLRACPRRDLAISHLS